MLTKEQIAERVEFLGASEIAGIMGRSPFKDGGRLAIYNRKVNPPTDDTPNKYVGKGNWLEPILRAKYCAKYNASVTESRTIRHPEHSWCGCTPDGLVMDFGKLVKALEIKVVGDYRRKDWGEPEGEGVPPYYYDQAQWTCFVTGVGLVDFFVSFGGDEPVLFRVFRNDAHIDELFREAKAFWFEHVMVGIPPIGTSAERIDLALEAAPEPTSKTMIEATPELGAAMQDYIAFRTIERTAKADKERAQAICCEAIGDNLGIAGDGIEVKWSHVASRKIVDWEAIAREVAAEAGITILDGAIMLHTKFSGATRRFDAKEIK